MCTIQCGTGRYTCFMARIQTEISQLVTNCSYKAPTIAELEYFVHLSALRRMRLKIENAINTSLYYDSVMRYMLLERVLLLFC